jgi:hypothetical protein
MSQEPDDPKKPDLATEEEGPELTDEEAPPLAALLKRSLAVPDEAPPSSASRAAGEAPKPTDADKALLLGVQKKLRKRSKGKFYADGWSTTQSRVSYALVAIVMLVTIIAVYLALGPTGIH